MLLINQSSINNQPIFTKNVEIKAARVKPKTLKKLRKNFEYLNKSEKAVKINKFQTIIKFVKNIFKSKKKIIKGNDILVAHEKNQPYLLTGLDANLFDEMNKKELGILNSK